MIYFIVGIAGVLGALFRYDLGLLIHSWWSLSFPLETLLINYLGCIILGWFTPWAASHKNFPSWIRVGFGTGFIGSFTTFSTFSAETLALIQKGLWGIAILYVLLSLWGGLLMAWCGYRLFKLRGITREE
ncbi:putative fluoride ion transporter CrcB 1 [Collibacillus ludicampi]|uniref:Fluoride-specific ion channel FluC n=1 Tax=Collibacillus ludicampi TaxID=2771369 RepID=A0AAV4LAA2_9BACL|nr:fluoride efflux transporter CrcB [Collibacillus ludicampi]GIM44705.1 putative fluoride ion transporter CrcB 1 [Collibacillus ludicampi]